MVLIDELDRCSPQDVVTTLTALRTFLDQEHCIHIVVADRDVLERALKQLPQVSPFNQSSPYYSSASAFIDKVFQHQLELPPLRVARLTKFARGTSTFSIDRILAGDDGPPSCFLRTFPTQVLPQVAVA